MNKKVIIGFLLILAGLLTFTIYRHFNPGEKIKYTEYESAQYYLWFYSKIMDENNFQRLVKGLIATTNNVTLLNNLTIYLKREKNCSSLPELEKKCLELESLPEDSVWVDKVSKNYSIKSSREMLNFDNSFCMNLRELKDQCLK